MTATNHALTGAAIGLIVGQPLIAIPLALVSHYVLDAMPHYRTSVKGEKFMNEGWFVGYLIAEAVLCFLIVLGLFISGPANWQLAAICAFVAAAPDLLSINRFLKAREGKKYKPGLYVRFASGIQWFERPIGGFVEIAWFIAMIFVIATFVV